MMLLLEPAVGPEGSSLALGRRQGCVAVAVMYSESILRANSWGTGRGSCFRWGGQADILKGILGVEF